MILISMMVLCTQVNKMYVIATLSAYPHRASLKNMPGHGGIRTYDLRNAIAVRIANQARRTIATAKFTWCFQRTKLTFTFTMQTYK